MNGRCSEQIGKLFIVTHGMRRCLICDGLFSSKEARDHALFPCYPAQPRSSNNGAAKLICAHHSSP